jgi:hypothetical protein
MPAETPGKSTKYVSIYTGRKPGPDNLLLVRAIENILREILGAETRHLDHDGIVEFVWDQNVINYATLCTALDRIREVCPDIGILYSDKSRVTT